MKRIWIYQSDKFLEPTQLKRIEEVLRTFVEDWTAHDNKLAGTAVVLYNLFVVLQVDESIAAKVSGCSIDKSVRILKDLESELSISLFDRLNVAYRNDKGDICTVSRQGFQDLLNQGLIKDNTIVFNNMIANGADFPSLWEIPFKDSWHARVFVKI